MEMDREYKSKVDWWYHLVVILLGMMTVISFVKGASPLAMIVAVDDFVVCSYLVDHEISDHGRWFPDRSM